MASRGVINVNNYTAGDGVTDDTAGILAAATALNDYTSGQGGGVLLFPEGYYQITSSITMLTSAIEGISLVGAGSHSSVIRGSVAGPLLTNDSGTQEVYNRIEGLGFLNTSTNTAARTVKTNNVNEFVMRDTWHSSAASGSGSSVCQLDSAYDLLVEDSAFEGASADHCIVGSTQNVATYMRCSLRATKGGMRLASVSGLNIIGCSFQNLTGSAVDGLNGAICLSACQGGNITGNYLESCVCSFLEVNATISRGFNVAGNFITNSTSPAIKADSFAFTRFAPNFVTPGANATNANAVSGATSNTSQCVLDPQYISSGTGVATLAGSATLTIASATTITLPPGLSEIGVSGTTGITSITAGDPGRVVTLVFGGALTVTDGSNLALAGNFTTATNATLTLASNGTNWYEVARSTN